MEQEIDYNIGVRLRRTLSEAIRRKSVEEFRSFNATVNMMLMQALKKTTIENLVEEVQKMSVQIETLTATIQSLSTQIGGKKK